VIHVRNALAHQGTDITEGAVPKIKVAKAKKKKEFTAGDCAQVRKNLRRHRDNLLALQKILA
jgi:hypothetical protein